jgi:hypothetical protein
LRTRSLSGVDRDRQRVLGALLYDRFMAQTEAPQ